MRSLVVLLALQTVLPGQSPERPPPFGVRVVEAATGRGVPLVELLTVHGVGFVTDSAGWCAIDEPELFGRRAWFHVRSHGYTVPADGFGYRGFACEVEPGGRHRFEITREQVAERLYRVTGGGIYRDSVMLGEPVPLKHPLAAGGVFGCDSVVNAVYEGRLYWFWGDTNRIAYPLGNFAVSGAISRWPADGGLAPDSGVDLDVFVDADGFAKKLCPIDGSGPVWVFGAMVVDHDGDERLLAHYARMKSLGERYEHGIVEWDDAAERLAKVAEFPLDAALHPSGNPLRVQDGDGDWFVFCAPYPNVRVAATRDAILDPHAYQALVGTADDGALEWRADTAPRTPEGTNDPFVARWQTLRDVETGRSIRVHGGTVHWNAHRRRWIALFLEVGGRSFLGEVWFAEADTPIGPWGYARRVVTHDRYSFYNVKQHPYFDGADGRLVYFEGTYTATFSGNEHRTQRYDYNQVMYRLDLGDPRLDLPVPVYRIRGDGEDVMLTGPRVAAQGAWSDVVGVGFFARRAPEETRGWRPFPSGVVPETAVVETVANVFRAPAASPPLWLGAVASPR